MYNTDDVKVLIPQNSPPEKLSVDLTLVKK